MKDRRSNWQMVVSGILIFAVWFGALPIYAQTRQDSKGVGVKVVSELPSKEKRWALIVGIDEYRNDVSTLKGSVNDARALKNVLVNNAGFPENQVVLLTTDSTEQDKRPTRENILGALSDLYSRVPEDGLLLFSFSGHGISVGNQAFLIPSNGRFTKNLTLLKNFSIDVSIIKEAIQEIKVKQVLMLLDACRNEPGKGDTPNRLTDAYKQGFSFDVANSDVKAFATLYATSIGERAFEFYDKDTKQFRGYFSHAVEEALKGKAANEKGEVTLSRLIDYLETTVPKKVKYDKGETQIPSANYSETYRANQLILAVTKKSKNNFTSPNSGEATFWNAIENSNDSEDFENYLRRIERGEFKGIYKSTAELKIAKLKKANVGGTVWSRLRPTANLLLKYDYVYPFSEDLAHVNLNSKYGFIDKNGNEVVPLKYDLAGSFSEGLASVGIGGLGTSKHGFIDKTGKEIISLKYDFADSFSEGLAAVGIGEFIMRKYAFIDKTGKQIIPFNDGRIARSFSEGLALVRFGDVLSYKYGFIDKTGKQIKIFPFKPNSDFAESFSEGLAVVTVGNYPERKSGFIDKTGKVIIPVKYNYADSFSEGLARVADGGKFGFIDKTGKVIISLIYDDVKSFSEGLAEVKIGDYQTGKWGLIDKTGKEIVPVKYDKIWCEAFIKEGFIGVILNGKKGFVDIYGNEYFDF